MDSRVPHSTQLNADPGRSSSLKTLFWGTQATDSCPEALGIAYQTPPEVASGLQACKYRPERALASRRAEGRGQADAPPWKPCQQVSVLYKRKSPAPCLPTSSSPALSLGWRWAVSRFSGGWGGGSASQTRRKARGGTSTPEPVCHLKGGPQPRGRLSQTERLPLPRSVAITSCFSSSPAPARSTAAAESSPGARIPGARAPLPPMCPPARAQSRGPAPSPAAGLRRRGRGHVSRSRLQLRGARQEPTRWPSGAGTRAECRVGAVSVCRAECSNLPVRAPRACAAPQVAGPGPPVPVGAHAGGAFPASGHALQFEKEAQWRTLNPGIDTVGVPSAWSKWDGVKSQYLSLLPRFTCFPGKVNPSNAWVASDVVTQLMATASPVLFMKMSALFGQCHLLLRT